MNAKVYWNDNDISSEIISYKRSQDICSGLGDCSVQVAGNSANSFISGGKIEIEEEGELKGTYYISSVTKQEPSYDIVLDAQDSTKWLADFFLDEKWTTDSPITTSRYWITTILAEVPVISYSLDFDDDGTNISEGMDFGNNNALDEIIRICVQNGWYLYADASGVIHIGKIDFDPHDPKLTVHDTDITDLMVERNDGMLRNRVIVRGMGNSITKKWTTAEVKQITPWNYDALDYRTTCITDPFIPDKSAALKLANQLMKETGRITYIKNVTLPGFYNLRIGESILVSSKKFNGVCLITSLEVSVSDKGIITSLILDERCPRLFGYVDYGGQVYVGTDGSGVWRKHLRYDHTWENFSDGLSDLYIDNLSIANGIFACTTREGYLYTRTIEDIQWNLFPVDAQLPYSGGYISSYPGLFNSCAVDRTNGMIYAGYNKHVGTTISGIYYVDPLDHGWVAEISPTYSKQYTEVTISGQTSVQVVDMDSNEDAAYVTAVGYSQSEVITPKLVVNPEVNGSLNTIASIRTVGTDPSFPSSLAHLYTLFGQESTTEYIDNSNIDSYDLPMSGGSITQMALYGKILYVAAGDRVYRINLDSKTYNTKVIGGSISDIGSADETHCSVIQYNLVVHLIYEISIDWTNLSSITSTQTDISIPDYSSIWGNSGWGRYIVDNDMKTWFIFAYTNDLAGGAVEHFSLPYLILDIETKAYSFGSIPIQGFSDGVPAGHSYIIQFQYIAKTRDIFSMPFAIFKLHREAANALMGNNLINTFGYITIDNGVGIAGTLQGLMVISGEPLSAYNTYNARVTTDGIIVTIAAVNEVELNSNPATATRGLSIRQYPSGGVVWEKAYVGSDSEATNNYNRQFIRSFTNKYAFNGAETAGEPIYTLAGASLPTTDRSIPNPTLSNSNHLWIDDAGGKFIITKKIGTNGSNSQYGLFQDDESTRILSNLIIEEPTSLDSSKSAIILLGGIILYKHKGSGSWVVYYSRTETPGSGGGTTTVLNQYINLLEYRNKQINYIAEVRGQFVDTAKTWPVVTFGGDAGYNSGAIENYYRSDGYIESLFVSSYVSDARVFDILTSSGISRCGLFATNHTVTSGIGELLVTDYNNILTSGINYGGIGIAGSGLFYTPIWKIHSLSGWASFSGVVTHIETTNYQDQPYFFVSLAGVPNRFFQKDYMNLNSWNTLFIDRSPGLPGSEITVIRCDDSI